MSEWANGRGRSGSGRWPLQRLALVSVASVASVGIALPTLVARLFAPPQDRANAVDVSRHHGQRNVALEAVDAMMGAAVEPMHLHSALIADSTPE